MCKINSDRTRSTVASRSLHASRQSIGPSGGWTSSCCGTLLLADSSRGQPWGEAIDTSNKVAQSSCKPVLRAERAGLPIHNLDTPLHCTGTLEMVGEARLG
jgi:hypothetical protein